MDISNRIKKLGKYFNEMQIVEENGVQVIYVIVTFPSRWIIDENFAKSKAVTIMEGDVPGQYFFCTDLETGEEAIFDVIDDNIDKMKEAIERAQLLTAKTKELKTLFENEDIKLEKLRTIRFTFDDDIENEEGIIIPKTKKDKNKNDE